MASPWTASKLLGYLAKTKQVRLDTPSLADYQKPWQIYLRSEYTNGTVKFPVGEFLIRQQWPWHCGTIQNAEGASSSPQSLRYPELLEFNRLWREIKFDSLNSRSTEGDTKLIKTASFEQLSGKWTEGHPTLGVKLR